MYPTQQLQDQQAEQQQQNYRAISDQPVGQQFNSDTQNLTATPPQNYQMSPGYKAGEQQQGEMSEKTCCEMSLCCCCCISLRTGCFVIGSLMIIDLFITYALFIGSFFGYIRFVDVSHVAALCSIVNAVFGIVLIIGTKRERPHYLWLCVAALCSSVISRVGEFVFRFFFGYHWMELVGTLPNIPFFIWFIVVVASHAKKMSRISQNNLV